MNDGSSKCQMSQRQVVPLTMPVIGRPWCFWNARTAVRVLGAEDAVDRHVQVALGAQLALDGRDRRPRAAEADRQDERPPGGVVDDPVGARPAAVWCATTASFVVSPKTPSTVTG